MPIQRVGVVGFGLMGSGIAQVCAQAGYDTLVREIDQRFLDNGFERVDGSLARLVKGGKLLKRMVLAGRLGAKMGRGFYEYDETGKRKPSA